MNICFYGVGGVGGYFGALAAQQLQNEHNIYFVARGAHKKAICEKGLLLKKDGGNEVIQVNPTLCTDTIEALPVCDIIVVSVKGYDLDEVSKSLESISTESTIVLPLLNGIDIYERIRKYFSKGIVLPACVYVGTHIESPGVIFQKGGSCKILCGSDPQLPKAPIDALLQLFGQAQINIEKQAEVQTAIWSKYMFIAAYGLVGAAYDKTLGEIMDNESLSAETKGIMREIELLAQGKQVVIPSTIVEDSFLKARDFSHDVKTSFHRDVEAKGKLNEGDLFGGTIIRMGKEMGMLTPVANRVYSKLMSELG